MRDERSVQIVSAPHFGLPAWTAAPATFGMNFTNGEKVFKFFFNSLMITKYF